MLFKALPESHSKLVICDQSITQILYTSKVYRQVIFIGQKKLGANHEDYCAHKRFDALDPRRVMEITLEVARLGESLSRSTKTRRKVLDRNADVLVGISNSQR